MKINLQGLNLAMVRTDLFPFLYSLDKYSLTPIRCPQRCSLEENYVYLTQTSPMKQTLATLYYFVTTRQK